MARVFAVPNYKNSSQARYGSLSQSQSVIAGAVMDELAEWSVSSFRAIIADETTLPDADKSAILDSLDLASDSPAARKAVANISRTVADICDGRTAYWDDDACTHLLYGLASGSYPIRGHHDARHTVSSDLGDALFTTGVVGSYCSIDAAVNILKEGRGYDQDIVPGVAAHRVISLADDIRLGWAFRGASSAIKTAYQDDITAQACKHLRTPLSESVPSLEWFSVGFLLIARNSTEVFIMNKNSRYALASCLYSFAMWRVAGAVDERLGSDLAATKGINFVLAGLKHAIRKRIPAAAVARSMKSSYAVMLCDMQTSMDATTRAEQRSALVAEVTASCPGLVFWHEEMSSVDRDLKVDYGTAWNLIPPADINAEQLLDSVRSKLNAPRTHNAEEWNDFISYSMASITARYIFENPTVDITWASGRKDDPSWAALCRTDRTAPTYPSAEERDHMIKALPWIRHLENWHHSAQDVTHIMADLSLYGKKGKRVPQNVANELTYVLHNGNTLSGAFSPASVRSSWERGRIPGDRVLYCAGKSENTKFGNKVRETMSADDVLRECLTEVDINMATISSYVGGVAMRAGRAGTEALINNVIKEANNGGTLISMDVSGWSPNMDRRGEMAFIDSLMSMFDIPDAMRVGSIFRDLNVVIDKYPVCTSFEMLDGSVQGFFGTADTIMHSMIAQWSLNRAKRATDGATFADAVVAKVALIDDILLCVKRTTASAREIIDVFSKGYTALSFTVDIVKSLAGSDTGVFLNRVYTKEGEITTSAKIFARADREWDRPVVGIYDEVSSILSGFSGAVDRGFSAIRAYRAAMYRVASRLAAAAHPVNIVDKATVALVAFLPSGLGGFNIPDIVSWITEMAGASLAAHISVITVAMRHAINGNPKMYNLCESVIRYVLSEPKSASDAWAVASSPAAVSYASFEDPMRIFAQGIAAAIKRRGLASDIANLVTATPSSRDVASLRSALSDGSYDAPLISDFMSALPPAVGEAIMSRFTKSSACIALMGLSRAAAARSKVNAISRAAICKAWTRVKSKSGDNDHPSNRATEIAEELISSRCAGLGLINTVIPSPLDSLSHVSESGTIKVFFNHAVGRKASKATSTITRTYTSSIAPSVDMVKSRDTGPIASAARRLTCSLSFIAATGSSVAVLVEIARKCWGIDNGILKILPVPDVNPRRLSIATASRNHCVRAYTNSSKSVSVSLDQELSRTSNARTNVDYMVIRNVLMATALIDLDAGCPVGITRHYVVRATSCFLQARPFAASSAPPVSVRKQVPNSVSIGFAAAVDFATSGAGEFVVVDIDQGEIAVLKPSENDARNAASAYNARDLYNAIVSSRLASGPGQVTHPDTAEVTTASKKALPAPLASLSKLLAPIKRMSRRAALDYIAREGANIAAAADSTKIPALQRAVRATIRRDNTSIRIDADAINSAVISAVEGSTTSNYVRSIRRAMVVSYNDKANSIRNVPGGPPTDRDRALAYGYEFLAEMCEKTSRSSSLSGVMSFGLIMSAVSSKCDSILRRTGLFTAEVAFPTSGTIAEAAATLAGEIIPVGFSDRVHVLAGVRFASRKMAVFINADAEAHKSASVALTPSKPAATGGTLDSIFASINFGTILSSFGGGVDEFDTSDIANAPATNTKNADNDD